MDKKRIAVVGCGGQGGWHAQHALKSDVVSLAGIYDIDPRMMEKAVGYGCRAYASFEEVLSDPTVDIVVCATPNHVHEEIVCRALRAGKHVICEKPVEMTVKAFDRMTDAARESGKLFVVHQNRRWDVDFLAVKSLIESGDVGKPLHIESRIHGSRGIPSDWRSHAPYGGGMILDWGVHLLDQMLCLLPHRRVTGVFCLCTHYTNTEVDDGCRITLTFEDGTTAYVEVGTLNFIALPRFYAQFDHGTAVIEDWQKKMQVTRCDHWHESEVVPVQTAAGITKTMAPRDEVTVTRYEVERPVSDVHDFYRNVVAAINGEAEVLVRQEEVRRVLAIMEACFASDRAHQLIKTDI